MSSASQQTLEDVTSQPYCLAPLHKQQNTSIEYQPGHHQYSKEARHTYNAVKPTISGARSVRINHPTFLSLDSQSLPGGGTLRCTAVQTQSSIVMMHVLRMSKVPRVLQLGCQCTMSVPLPNKSELILCSVVQGMMPRCHFQ